MRAKPTGELVLFCYFIPLLLTFFLIYARMGQGAFVFSCIVALLSALTLFVTLRKWDEERLQLAKQLKIAREVPAVVAVDLKPELQKKAQEIEEKVEKIARREKEIERLQQQVLDVEKRLSDSNAAHTRQLDLARQQFEAQLEENQNTMAARSQTFIQEKQAMQALLEEQRQEIENLRFEIKTILRVESSHVI